MRGQPHYVLISGEAGIGKTRLAEELLTWAERQGIAAARTRAYAAGQGLAYPPPAGWHTWLQVARGLVELNGDELRAGDGAAISNEPQIELASSAGAEVLLFDLE